MPVEDVRVGKERVTDTEQVSAKVRKERADVDIEQGHDKGRDKGRERAPAGLTGNPAVPAGTRSDLTADPLQLTPIPAPYPGWGSCYSRKRRACGRSPLLPRPV